MPSPFVRRAAAYGAVWWMLTGSTSDGWGAGVIFACLAAAFSLHLRPSGARRIVFAALPGFLAFFVLRSTRGGLQVAGAALRPRLDLKPAILDIPLRLSAEDDRIFLAGMLSLMPGTLGAGLDGGRLQLHVLDRRRSLHAEVRAAEERVARLFGAVLQ